MGLLWGRHQSLLPLFLGHFSDSDGSENLTLITHSKCCLQPKNNRFLKHIWFQCCVAMGFFSSRVCRQTSRRASSRRRRNVLRSGVGQTDRQTDSGLTQEEGAAGARGSKGAKKPLKN